MSYVFHLFLPSSVKVKWGKELYPDVEVNTSEEPLVLKAQIYALTGVKPERQKVMLKGSTLKDDKVTIPSLSQDFHAPKTFLLPFSRTGVPSPSG